MPISFSGQGIAIKIEHLCALQDNKHKHQVFTVVYLKTFTRRSPGYLPRMSFASVKAQHAEINRIFEERYDELSGLAVAVKDGLKKLVAESELDEDAAVWALRSLDFRERPLVLI